MAGFSNVNVGLWLQLLLKSCASPERRLSSLHTDLPKGAPIKLSRLRVNLRLLSSACMLSHFSHVQLFAAPWTVACQAPLSMVFSRQKYWSGLPCPPPGDLPNSGIEPMSLISPALAGSSLPLAASGYGCESWTIKKAECQRIDAFELWCWRRLLRVPWTARRSRQCILKEISSGWSLEGMMLKLKLQYFGHLM